VYQILSGLHVVLAVFSTGHLLLHYRRSAPAVAWLFAFWAIPVLGPLFYLFFFARREPRAIRQRRQRAETLRGADRDAAVGEVGYPDDAAPHGIGSLDPRVAAFPLCGGNAVEIFPTGDAAFDAMLGAIAGARGEICLATYILETGGVAHRLRETLKERVAAGVEVRLLYDQFGSTGLATEFLSDLRSHGIEVAGFLEPNPLKGRFQLNFRNHRKILVVDNEVAFTGGQNWGDEYSERHCMGRLRRDLHVRVRGPAVACIRRVFHEDWSLATGRDLPPRPVPGAEGDLAVRVIPHGPDEENERLTTVLATAIHGAREEVLVVTPYFVPGEAMRGAVRIAALRGARVTLLVPERSDALVADLAARRHFDRLLDAGVEIRLAQGPFLHAKALVADRCWATVGSANYDQRSFQYNYELNIEVADRGFAERLHAHFAPLVEAARLLDEDEFDERPAWRRAAENAANLFEPLL